MTVKKRLRADTTKTRQCEEPDDDLMRKLLSASANVEGYPRISGHPQAATVDGRPTLFALLSGPEMEVEYYGLVFFSKNYVKISFPSKPLERINANLAP